MLMAMTGVGLLWVGWYGFNVAPAVLVADEYFVLVSGRVVRDAMCHALSGGGLHRSSCACVCVCVCVCVRARARARLCGCWLRVLFWLALLLSLYRSLQQR